MNNVFDTDTYPTTEPDDLVAGDRWVWRKNDVSTVYTTDSYDLEYRLTNQSTGITQTLFADVVDDVFVIQISGAETADYAAGNWHWVSVIVRKTDSEEAVVNQGFFDITASATASHTLKVLNAIRATIEGTASEDQQRIEINGRVLERRSIEDLMRLESVYSKRWREEKNKIARGQGRPVNSRVLVKMGA